MVNLLQIHTHLKAEFTTEVSPSARADVCAPLDISEQGDDEGPVSEPYVKRKDQAETRQMVERWRATLPITRVDRKKGGRSDVQAPCNPHPRPDLDLMSPLSVDLFKDAASTTVSSDCTEVGNNKGHWLVSIKRR